MKKINLLILGIMLFSWTSVVHAESNKLPDVEEGVIKLTDNVNLDETFKIEKDTNIIIDLAGHTINYSKSDSYAINNLGTVKIIDSSNGQGKIICSQEPGSCVRNNNSMEIDGVTIISDWLTVKNEEVGNLTVKNSTIKAKRVDKNSVAIQNWGKAVVDNCNVIGEGEGTIAISEWSYTSGGVKYNSEITIKNTKLNAPYAVDSRSYQNTDTTQKIIFENVKVEQGDIQVEKGATFVSDNTENTLNAIQHSKSGATIVVSNDFVASDLNIPEGVNVEIGEGNNNLERVEKDGKVSFVRKNNTQTPEEVKDNNNNNNPDTSDINIYLLLGLIIASGCGLIYLLIKKRTN